MGAGQRRSLAMIDQWKQKTVTVGDIHWVQLPSANGIEQRGRRPAVILQDDQYGGGLPVVFRCPADDGQGNDAICRDGAHPADG